MDAVLKKELSFHFYGQPSYRPKPSAEYGTGLGSALFCLILDFNALPPPSSILPFDSGGYGGTMQKYCEGIAMSEFFLDARHEAPGKLVSALFGTNRDYFGMKVRPDASDEVAKFDFHSQGLIRLYSSDGPVPYDQRAGSIEVHYDGPLHITKENLIAIIAPDLVCEEPELRLFATSRDAQLVPYPFDHEDPAVRQRQIRDAARAWLDDNGYLDVAK